MFRLNNAPVSTHEADVGQKTTFRIVGHPAWSKIKNDKITLLVSQLSLPVMFGIDGVSKVCIVTTTTIEEKKLQ